jgi:hypothetical protein
LFFSLSSETQKERKKEEPRLICREGDRNKETKHPLIQWVVSNDSKSSNELPHNPTIIQP